MSILRGIGRTVEMTRPNNTTAYTANDVIGHVTGTSALEFKNVGLPGRPIIITDVNLRIDLSAVTSGMTQFRLHLYSATPPSALADNAAFDIPAGDRAYYLGYVDLATPTDLGSTLYSQNTSINKGVTLFSTSLFGYLVTIGGFTPGASTVKSISLVATGEM